jgi:hypothetical protein
VIFHGTGDEFFFVSGKLGITQRNNDPLARQAFGITIGFDKLEQRRVLDRFGAEIPESEFAAKI